MKERSLDVDDLDCTLTLSEWEAAARVPDTRPAPPQVPSTPDVQPPDRAWFDYAACRGLDPGIFYPEVTRGDSGGAYDRARAICGACPVREQCLAWALEHEERDGVWGGITARQRRDLGFKRACAWCRHRFPVTAGGSNRAYCSPGCRRAARAQTVHDYETRKRSTAA